MHDSKPMLNGLKNRWNHLTDLSAWLGLSIWSFWREPPVYSTQASTQLGSFGQFFLTLAVGLMAIPVFRYRQRQHTGGWSIVAVVLFLMTPGAYFLNDWCVTTWTCPYSASRVVVGPDAARTKHGIEYMDEYPDKTCEQIVWDHAGKVEEVWKKDSIETRRLTLDILYVAFLPLFAGSMICVIQASYCGTR